MTTVLAAFCAAAGIPDPYASLVERARADAETFRRETGNLLDVVGLAAYKRDPLYETHARLEMWLARGKGDSRKVAHLLWRIRAMSEALGGQLGPSLEEERFSAYRVTQFAVDVAAESLDADATQFASEGMTTEARRIRSLLSITDVESAANAHDLLANICDLGAGTYAEVCPLTMAERATAMLVAMKLHDAAEFAGRAIDAYPPALTRARALVAELTGVTDV